MINIIFKIEKWKWNKDFQLYISNFGHIKNKNKKAIPLKMNSRGYLAIETINGLQYVHRLVLSTFRPVIDSENLTVDHINHNKRDNRLSNLEWVTRKENERRASNDLLSPLENESLENNKIKILYTNKKMSIERIFYSYEDAFNFLRELKGKELDNLSIERFKINIRRAIKKEQQYCSGRWELI